MARLLILVISVLGILYLTATQLNRGVSSTGATKTIIDKPTEVRQDINQSMNKAEKVRENATKESQ